MWDTVCSGWECCHGGGRLTASTIKNNDTVGPGNTATFTAMMMASGSPAPWQLMTQIHGKLKLPLAFRRSQKSAFYRAPPTPSLCFAAGAKRWYSDVNRGLCDWGDSVIGRLCDWEGLWCEIVCLGELCDGKTCMWWGNSDVLVGYHDKGDSGVLGALMYRKASDV